MQSTKTTVLHPALVRITHWTWALGVLILIGSGLRIYNPSRCSTSISRFG